MAKNKIIIVGAGPGGLTAGLLLATKGFDVQIFEKDNRPGGRNQTLEFDGYKFDTGPTFLMMKFILDEVFEEAGYRSEDYLKFTRLDPMYRLYFTDNYLDVYFNHEKLKQELRRVFPGEEKGVSKFLDKEGRRFKRLFPCLQKDYSAWYGLFNKSLLKAIPILGVGRSLYQVLGSYFSAQEARLSFTFQSKYLGMSPWECPGGFAIIPYVEHAFGIYHVEGGLSRISEVMADLIVRHGGKIHYGKTVKKVLFRSKDAYGVELMDGQKVGADDVIINADFGYAAANLLPTDLVGAYSKEKVAKKKYSCSTLMFYWGMKKFYKTEHHSVIFAHKYRENVNSIFGGENFTIDDFSFYVRNSSVSDNTVAPKGKSQFYILVPVPNKQVNAQIDWEQAVPLMKKRIIGIMEQRLGIKDVAKNIEAEKIVTPNDWVSDYNVFFGATFNLSHKLTQMLYFRPHNRLNGVRNCYLVGGGTHPGSGLPTIYESARITTKLITDKSSK